MNTVRTVRTVRKGREMNTVRSGLRAWANRQNTSARWIQGSSTCTPANTSSAARTCSLRTSVDAWPDESPPSPFSLAWMRSTSFRRFATLYSLDLHTQRGGTTWSGHGAAAAGRMVRRHAAAAAGRMVRQHGASIATGTGVPRAAAAKGATAIAAQVPHSWQQRKRRFEPPNARHCTGVI
eukprot:91401-Chlamydomonas_euryale.AAC.2